MATIDGGGSHFASVADVAGRSFLLIRASVLALCLLAMPASPMAQPSRTQPIVLIGANVLDEAFAATVSDQTIVIRDGRIVAVGADGEVPIPEDARTIDVSGKTIIPGLWDVHVHTRYEGIDHLRLILAHGITSMRDMGGPWEHLGRLNRWRGEISRGETWGPRIWTGGTILNNPGANWSHIAVVNTPEEGRSAVRRLNREGADFVKVYSDLSLENYLAIADEARVHALPFDGHIPLAMTPTEVSQAGQRSIEHTDILALALATREPERNVRGWPLMAGLVGSLGTEKAEQLARVFRANGTHVVPTLALVEHFSLLSTERQAITSNPALRFIPRPYIETWEAALRESDVEEAQASASLAREVTRLLHRNGVPIIAGTDTVKPYFVPGDALHDELAMLVRAGLTEGEAIQAATLTPAQMMGERNQGLVQPGYVADLLVLDANPLADITNTRRISMVVTDGRLLDRDTLDAMLDNIAATASTWSGIPSGR